MAKTRVIISENEADKALVNTIKELLNEDTRNRVPAMFTDAYMLQESDALDGMDESKIINDLDVRNFATLRTVFVTGLMSVENGKILRVNGEIDIPMEKGKKLSLFETLFTDKQEAIEQWEKYMENKLRVVTEKWEAYAKLVDFFKKQVIEKNY